MKSNFRIFLILVLCALFSLSGIYAQNKIKQVIQPVELSGNLSFDINSQSGKVTGIAITVGDGGTGQFKAIMTCDLKLLTHTIFRPADLSVFDNKNKLPIVAFANGGCRNSSGEFRNFLSEIASHGFLVISIGPINNTLLGGGELATGGSEPKQLLDAIDWAISENDNSESIYYQRIDVSKIAVMGQSCGGIQALAVSNDPRITTTLIWNSGLFSIPIAAPNPNSQNNSNSSAKSLMPSVPKSDLKKLHGPIAYFTGGEYDMATKNADDDFTWIESVPVIHANYDFSTQVKEKNDKIYGHYPATYREPNGGAFAIAGVAWLNWHLKGDKEAANIFKGEPCRLVLKDPKWSVVKKNID